MVRELGHDLIPPEEVREEILAAIRPIEAEECPLARASGRVLREGLAAGEPVPSFDSSAMDGYAVRIADLAGAAPGRPVALRVVATLPAGALRLEGVEPGTAVRIMTGAPVPPGADAVVPHELTRAAGDRVLFETPSRPGEHLRRAGADLRPGDAALAAGVRLGGPQLALAAALGRTRLRVSRRPRVAVLSTGDELVEPGAIPGPGQIRATNGIALAALIEEMGADAVDLGIAGDRRDDLRDRLRRAVREGADAIVSSGGVSAGDHDHVQAIAREEGKPGKVFKVALRPGKPQAFAVIDGVPLFGLPGNPAAAVISFVVFVRPALRKMLGELPVLPDRFPVRFEAPFRYKPGRAFVLRARAEPDMARGGFRVAAIGPQDSSLLSSLAQSNALIFLPGDRDAAAAGEVFPAEWIRG
jgi:molybdopterin molybdotransferase